MFVAQQFTTPSDLADLDFFPFPLMGTQFDGENAIEAPIDGFMLSKSPANPDAAKALLEFLAKGSTQTLYHQSEASDISTASDADASGYSPLQKRAQTIIASSQRITQFMDRDTRADFAGANGMQAFLQSFLSNPNQNLDPFLSKIQSFYDSLGPLS
jgi:multiple sugar transport system substrate-binding protein